MADAETTGDDSTSLLNGIAFTILMIPGAAFFNDARLNTRVYYENRSNPSQRIELESGNYYSGTARIGCLNTAKPQWVTQSDEIVEYRRSGDVITFTGTQGSAVFTISNQGLMDADNVVWDRKFHGD